MKKAIVLKINGAEYSVAAAPNDTLSKILREDLKLTGTKQGCGRGVCGSCTVLIDGIPQNSCLLLAARCEGKEITTIEGIAENGGLHPLQKSFVRHGAIQCGFCTPGMVVGAKALIDRNPEPTDAEIKEALGGNLCRCTGYVRIIEAVKNYKKLEGGESVPAYANASADKFQSVGKSAPRVDAIDKVSGRAKYTDDLSFSGMLFGKILTSPIAHGIIKKIDTQKARALPGVKAVITGADVPDILYGVSPARYDEHILAKNKVRYVGDEVAAVCAVSEEIAEQALKLIEVEYEELPAVFDPFEAIKKGAPQIHELYVNNINTEIHHHFGDTEKGFREADYVREEMFVGNLTTQAPIEPHCSISYWDGDGRLVLHTATQTSHYVHYQMARVLGIPMGEIRVIRPNVGGGFGGKAETTPLDICSAIFAKMTGAPVKMRYTRSEMFYHHRGRHKQYIKYKIGVKKDGRITAVKSEIHLDGGAYTSYGIIAAYYAGSMICTSYKIPNYKYDGYRVVTNKPACGAMRGNGTPQPRFAFETLLTMIAEDISVDPIEFRLINAMEPNFRTVNDLDIRSCEFKATLKRVREKSGWSEKHEKLPEGKGVGVGCGGFVSGAGYPIYRSKFPHSNAVIKINEDGTNAVLFIGAAEIGQGSDTVLTQIAAEALGVPLERVRIRSDDSDICPVDLGAYSSRTTLMGGRAVADAGFDIRKKLLKIASDKLGYPEETLSVKNGKIFVRDDSSEYLNWADAARAYFSQNGPLVGAGHYSPPEGLGGTYKGAPVGTSPAYSFASTVCEVSVDAETGKVKIEKFTNVHDCGTPINPMAVHGQVEGASVMGASETLLEEIRHNELGEILNDNLHDYLLMTINEAPEITSECVESYEPEGPFGAKEVGEGAELPIIPAIVHALKSATGVWFKELPVTPEKILRALKEKG